MKRIPVVILAVSFACLACACASAAPVSKTTQPPSYAGETMAAPSTTFFLAAPAVTPVMYVMGETAALGSWNITVSSYEIEDKIADDYQSFSPNDGDQYVVVAVKIRNTGASAAVFISGIDFSDDISAKIIYQTYTYSATELMGYGEDLFEDSIDPQSSQTGIIAFDMPADAANSQGLVLQFTYNQDAVGFTLR